MTDPTLDPMRPNEHELGDGEDDDPVVDEWDVILSDTRLQEDPVLDGPFTGSNVGSGPADRQLMLLQYNLNESPLFSDARINSFKVKPSFSLFQMDVAMNMEKNHFDRHRSESLANKIDGNKMRVNDKVHFPEGRMERFVLTSQQLKPSVSKFAVGRVKKKRKQVIMVPVDSTLELKSNVAWLDKTEIKVKGKGATKQQDEIEEAEDEEPPETPKKGEARVIHARFAGAEEAKIKAARERSYQYFQSRVNEEPWKDLRINTSESKVAKDERYHLFSGLMNASAAPSTSTTTVTPSHFEDMTSYLRHLAEDS